MCWNSGSKSNFLHIHKFVISEFMLHKSFFSSHELSWRSPYGECENTMILKSNAAKKAELSVLVKTIKNANWFAKQS